MRLKRSVALLLCCVTLLSLSPVMAATDQIVAGSGTATQGKNGGSGTTQGYLSPADLNTYGAGLRLSVVSAPSAVAPNTDADPGAFDKSFTDIIKKCTCSLFPILLTDRGSEFTDPVSIECTTWGEIRSRIFYCDPQRSDQKGGCEVTHEFIRRILPKGTSFDHLQQSDILLMMSHINSYTRKKLNNQSAHRLFSFLYGESILPSLGIREIPANDINLTPRLLKK